MTPMDHRLLRPKRRRAKSFSPLSVGGLEAWWDAADASTMTLDGGRVAAWADKSGNGLDLENSASGSTQPDYALAVADTNGQNAVLFDRTSSQVLSYSITGTELDFFVDGTPADVFFVIRSTTTVNWTETVLELFNSSIRRFTNLFAPPPIGGKDALLVQVRNASNQNVAYTAGVSDFYGVLLPSQTHLVQVRLDLSSAVANDRLSGYVDNGSQLDGNTSSSAASVNAGSGFLTVGNGTGTVGFGGYICEILMFSEHVSAESRQSLVGYLASKWGVTVA